jgi:HSP20 family protein
MTMESTSMREQRGEREDGVEAVSDRPVVVPYVDVFENEQELVVVADLPGVARDDLTIRLEENELTIEARRSPVTQGAPLATEYRTADYRRSFVLPRGIDRDAIDARLTAGVLRVGLPKAAAARPRRIEIKAG